MGIRARTDEILRRPAAKALVAASCLLPLALVLWGALAGSLSPNPIDDVTDATGTWTLRFIVITLALRPLREVLRLNGLLRYGRMAGLFAFFYGSLHFLTYLWLDQFFAWPEILSDIGKRPFIAVGFASFALMVPLALTSADRIARRIGGKRWKRLHRLVYAIAAGAVVHYLWLVKADRTRPLTYGAIVGALLAYRLWSFWRGRASRAASM